MATRIEIPNIEIDLHIGCDAQERSTIQTVFATLVITNYQKFRACHTDNINDTLDVSALKQTVRECIKINELHTLERLGQLLEENLRKKFPQTGLNWEIQLLKKNFGWKYVQTWSS